MHARPLIVQSDGTILLHTAHDNYSTVRNKLLQFAENSKSPEYVHFYKVTRLSLWNAAANGWTSIKVVQTLQDYSEFPVPVGLKNWIVLEMQKYGMLRLVQANDSDQLLLTGDSDIIQNLKMATEFKNWICTYEANGITCKHEHRGAIKRSCLKLGYPVLDQAGFLDGEACEFQWNTNSITLRPYQKDAVEHFFAGGEGNGVIVLPCGAGKTMTGIAIMQRLGRNTLILTPNATSAEQWRIELLKHTTLKQQQVGIYTSQAKTIFPVTIATYQMIIQRNGENFPHFDLLSRAPWGFVIYDEVHLLPAPIFRMSADLQSRRRLGLTATLVREDGQEEEVFTLVGPKKYDVPWKTIEKAGWIASTRCIEVSVPFLDTEKFSYLQAGKREQHRLAAENKRKIDALELLVKRHEQDHVLIIGQYIEQLEMVSNRLQVPVITGKTPLKQRTELFQKFKNGELRSLVVSKVANVAVDIPCANVAIQLSGTFGSRQEEAQRLGRILRPNQDGKNSYFYTLVTKHTLDQDSSIRRQMFLTEQGYQYECVDFEDILQGVEL